MQRLIKTVDSGAAKGAYGPTPPKAQPPPISQMRQKHMFKLQ